MEKEAGFFSFVRWGVSGIIMIIVIIALAVFILFLGRFSLFSVASAAVLFFALAIFVLVKASERITLPSEK